jgi:hypothetical protein
MLGSARASHGGCIDSRGCIRLEPQALKGAAGWLLGYRRFWEDRLDLLERRLRETSKK